MLQIADKDFSSGLEQLARGSNRDVRDQTLGKIQEWAVAFKGKDNLRDTSLVRTYERIKNEGLPFPAKDPTATAAMVDSLSVRTSTHSLHFPGGDTKLILSYC